MYAKLHLKRKKNIFYAVRTVLKISLIFNYAFLKIRFFEIAAFYLKLKNLSISSFFFFYKILLAIVFSFLQNS